MWANVTNETVDPYPRDEQLAQIEIGTLTCIFLVSVIGNGLVLIALYSKKCRSKKTLSRMYFFIFHLCVADLINAFFNILPQLLWDITYRFKGGQILCKAVKYGQILGPYLSSYILMVTALDRYRAICYPLTYHFWSSKRSRMFVAYAWCISIVFSIPQKSQFVYKNAPEDIINPKFLNNDNTDERLSSGLLGPKVPRNNAKTFIFSYQEVAPGIWDCWGTFSEVWGERAYVVWYSVSIFIVPLAGLIFTYTFICRVIWRNTPTKLGKQEQFISRAKINTIKQTVAVIAAYIFCSLPFIVAELWVVFDPSAYDEIWAGPVFTILVLLSSLNSCANPWIFMIFNSDLFVSLRHLFGRKRLPPTPCLKNSNSDCETRKKAWRKGCLNIRKLLTSNRPKRNHFDLRSRVISADENGTTTATEITILTSSG